MTKPELQRLLRKCFYGDVEHEEAFKDLEYLIDESEELDKIKKALKEVEFGCIDKQEKGWTVDGFVPSVLGGYINDLKNE
jgi:hypothetical protein